MKNAKVFYECGCCGQYHPASFAGDCRDDDNRYNVEDLPEGWQEVSDAEPRNWDSSDPEDALLSNLPHDA